MSAANKDGGSGEGTQAGNVIAVVVQAGEIIVQHLHIACPVKSGSESRTFLEKDLRYFATYDHLLASLGSLAQIEHYKIDRISTGYL